MIFLVGYTGAGKSTIGKRLANYLNYSFTDLDHYIETQENQTISQIFELQGETGFRAIEQRALHKLIQKLPNESIVASGGGTPCFFDNMEVMKSNGLVIFLATPLSIIKTHLKNHENRPLIGKLALMEADNLMKHYKERVPFYLQSHLKVPLKQAKSPELLTMTLILFTNINPAFRILHKFV